MRVADVHLSQIRPRAGVDAGLTLLALLTGAAVIGVMAAVFPVLCATLCGGVMGLYAFARERWILLALAVLGGPTVSIFADLPGVLGRVTPGVVLAGLFACWTLLSVAIRRATVPPLVRRVMLPMLFVVMIGAFSSIIALIVPDPGVIYAFPHSDISHLVTALTQAALVFITLAVPVGVVLACRSPAQRRQLGRALLGGAVLATTVAIISLVMGTGSQQILGLIRPGSGALTGPGLGIALLPVLPLAFSSAVAESGRGERVMATVITMYILLGIGLSLSRITWLAAAVEVVLLLILMRGKMRGGVVALGALTLGLALVSSGISTWILRFYDPTQVYGLERLDIWQIAIEIWRTHPILGVGMGNYQFFDLASGARLSSAGISHNQYLTILAEEGPLALIALVAFVVGLLGVSKRYVRNALGRHRIASVTTLVATIGMAVWGLGGDTFVTSASFGGGTVWLTLTLPYWLIVGLFLAEGGDGPRGSGPGINPV